MKTNFIAFTACIILVCIFTSFSTRAQQLQSDDTKNYTVQVAVTTGGIANYTYKIFQAPNKMLGYDIFCNGKIVFHQTAAMAQLKNSTVGISKKEHAEKAALFSIEKIKKNEPATLTQEEIKSIVYSIK